MREKDTLRNVFFLGCNGSQGAMFFAKRRRWLNQETRLEQTLLELARGVREHGVGEIASDVRVVLYAVRLSDGLEMRSSPLKTLCYEDGKYYFTTRSGSVYRWDTDADFGGMMPKLLRPLL